MYSIYRGIEFFSFEPKILRVWLKEQAAYVGTEGSCGGGGGDDDVQDSSDPSRIQDKVRLAWQGSTHSYRTKISIGQ